MSDATGDELAPNLTEALREAQRLERLERKSDLERQQQADDKIVDALGAHSQRQPQ